MALQSTRLLRLNQVIELTSLSRTTIYDRMSRGTFPRQIPLGPRIVVWDQLSIENWIQDQINASQKDPGNCLFVSPNPDS